jgi:hypothetical protein
VFKTSDGYINIVTTGGLIWELCAQAIAAGRVERSGALARSPIVSSDWQHNRDPNKKVDGTGPLQESRRAEHRD